MTPGIDLSCDLGEAADDAQQVVEDALWPLITSANVACGAHAGDERTMRHAAALARRQNVRLGAHPSYPDRENFGRRTLKIDPAVLRESITTQIRALAAIAGTLTHVKPHGALYNDAHHDSVLARTISDAVTDCGRPAMVCSADSALFQAAGEKGLVRIAEAFADRRYQPDGSLVPRSQPDALLLDVNEAAAQALSLARDGTVTASNGEKVRIRFSTLCIHSDMENSVERLQAIRARLSSAGFSFGPP